MTRSLFLAQQSVNRRLEDLEDQALEEEMASETSDILSNPLHNLADSTPPADARERRTNNRTSRMIDAVVYEQSSTMSFVGHNRTSVFLNERRFQ